MNLLPFEDITYRTNLSEQEVISRLEEIVEPKKMVRFDFFSRTPTKAYEGEINGNSFNIQRIIRYRNSFLPDISGLVESDSQGTSIHVTMQLHPFVIVFLCIWLGFVGMFSTVSLTSLFSENPFTPITLLPLGMAAFVYAMTMAGFKFESKRSKKDLQALFEGEV